LKRDQKFTLINLALHIGAVSPTVWLIIALLLHKLGPNPIQTLEQRSGDTALVLLLLTLACTPIRLLTGFSFINRFRRTLGLYTFGYAVIHLLLFVGLDYGSPGWNSGPSCCRNAISGLA
jgi:sulfoxide reductase heme-binding subunit YedZ